MTFELFHANAAMNFITSIVSPLNAARLVVLTISLFAPLYAARVLHRLGVDDWLALAVAMSATLAVMFGLARMLLRGRTLFRRAGRLLRDSFTAPLLCGMGFLIEKNLETGSALWFGGLLSYFAAAVALSTWLGAIVMPRRDDDALREEWLALRWRGAGA